VLAQGKRVGVFKDDMYVELRIVGMPHDTATQQSPHQNNTGCLVVDQDFSFGVRFPEMAVLLVLLKDQDSVMSDTILGYASLPLADLAPGTCEALKMMMGMVTM
jgi:phosphatidylinositol phospholipase C delta